MEGCKGLTAFSLRIWTLNVALLGCIVSWFCEPNTPDTLSLGMCNSEDKGLELGHNLRFSSHLC